MILKTKIREYLGLLIVITGAFILPFASLRLFFTIIGWIGDYTPSDIEIKIARFEAASILIIALLLIFIGNIIWKKRKQKKGLIIAGTLFIFILCALYYKYEIFNNGMDLHLVYPAFDEEISVVSSLRSINSACKSYREKYGSYPHRIQDLSVIGTQYYIDAKLRSGEKDGYSYDYYTSDPNHYRVNADFLYNKTLKRRYSTNESGIIKKHHGRYSINVN